MEPVFEGRGVRLFHADCLAVLRELPDASVDSVVTDPPYELGFMGKSWDNSGIAYSVELWSECLRVLKPGGHVLAFGGSRTWHRLACAIEDAGFDIRDSIAWLYGSGFPKSLDVSKAIDKAAGAERDDVYADAEPNVKNEIYGKGLGVALVERRPATADAQKWQGWGTALKPAHEPIVVARKPLEGTVAANVLAHGVGGLNIDGCRIGDDVRTNQPGSTKPRIAMSGGWRDDAEAITVSGRWPANVVLDELAALVLDESRFFYVAKASKRERPRVDGVAHPTVKPLSLMRWLVRLVTPPNGVVLEPFAGSGTTIEAAMLEGMQIVACEMTDDYLPLILERVNRVEVPSPSLFDGEL